MGNTTKTKAAMLNELESIKGLLLEEDDIPILQEEVLDQNTPLKSVAATHQEQNVKIAEQAKTATKITYEEQQDFFHSIKSNDTNHSNTTHNNTHNNTHNHKVASAPTMDLVDTELLDTLNELEKHTAEVTAGKPFKDTHKHGVERPNLAKGNGENPFLPEHIRARLHGNNPPPLFANVTARKISNTSVPSRLLGNTFTSASNATSLHKPDIIEDMIESIIEKIMPELEQALRSRLELMSKSLLEELNK